MDSVADTAAADLLVDPSINMAATEIKVETNVAPIKAYPLPLPVFDSHSFDCIKSEPVINETSDKIIATADVGDDFEKQLYSDNIAFVSSHLSHQDVGSNIIDSCRQSKPSYINDEVDSIGQEQSNVVLDRLETAQHDVDDKHVGECDSHNSASVPWPVHMSNNASVDGDDPSQSSDNANLIHQQPVEIKTWPFPRHLGSVFPPNSGLSRGSSDVDLCTVDSVDGSKQGCSLEGSEHCSSSQSPLSYVIQLNEDSECSLPSEAGNAAGCPTGFDKILMDRVNCETESVNESMELDVQQADSEHIMDVGNCIESSDVTKMTENLTTKAARNSSQRNRRTRKNKNKEEAVGDELASEQSTSRNRQRKKVSLTTELENASNALDVDGKKGVFEYQWPPDDEAADWYLLQEHISEFLGVLSFKRKYPDISRRTVDMNERDFLHEQGVVTEMQCDLGLTALLADEVYDIMESDYPEKFKEYAKVIHKKEKQKAVDHQKSSEGQPNEKAKMETVLKKSVKSAAEFNASLMRELRQERRAYFDLQTFEVHYPKSRKRVLPKEDTAMGSYPVAVIPGQFQDYYKRYTPTELNYFPLNTALYSPHKALASVYAESSAAPAAVPDDSDEERHKPPPVVVDAVPVIDATPIVAEEVPPIPLESDVKPTVPVNVPVDDAPDVAIKEDIKIESAETPVKKVRRLTSRKKKHTNSESVLEVQNRRTEPVKLEITSLVVEQAVVVTCSVCDQVEINKSAVREELVTCATCSRSGHPSCLDLATEMIPIIKTYEWQCMECKACVKCMKPHDEEKMMFCDHCDRGYHTFCVGVEEIPEGRWECPSCTLEAASPPVAKPKRGRPFKYPRPVPPPVVPT